MESTESPSLPARPATDGISTAASSVAADTALAVWERVGLALDPIVGVGGVGGLYRRSLHLTAGVHPCLQSVHLTPELPASRFLALHTVLAALPAQDAMAVHQALYATFCDLLNGLIGPSLTQRLLAHVEDPPS